MTKFIPLKKQSKKAQRSYHLKQRKRWEGISPVTRVSPDEKKYDRSREKRKMMKEINAS